jgi:hypothetical protein
MAKSLAGKVGGIILARISGTDRQGSKEPVAAPLAVDTHQAVDATVKINSMVFFKLDRFFSPGESNWAKSKREPPLATPVEKDTFNQKLIRRRR